ncbi:MAG: hypothetical protein PHD95_02195 [Candidatus ainarchaeum sp.]|nr:hypothetical protein [Candidatus ainarchaeum sp.]
MAGRIRRFLGRAKPRFVRNWQIRRLEAELARLQQKSAETEQSRRYYLDDIQELRETKRTDPARNQQGIWDDERRISGRLQADKASQSVDLKNRIRTVQARITELKK